jgi:hypothetical protein
MRGQSGRSIGDLSPIGLENLKIRYEGRIKKRPSHLRNGL